MSQKHPINFRLSKNNNIKNNVICYFPTNGYLLQVRINFKAVGPEMPIFKRF
jgi:hypothetical protein